MEENFLEKCRACLKKSSKMYQLTMKVRGYNSEATYGKLLQESARLECLGEYEHHMPQNICNLCCKELRKAYTFIRQAQFSNKILIRFIDKQQLSNTSEEPVVVSLSSESNSQNNTWTNEFENVSTNVLLRSVKLENVAEYNEHLQQQQSYRKEFCDSVENNSENVETNQNGVNLISDIKSEFTNDDLRAIELPQNENGIINSLDNKTETNYDKTITGTSNKIVTQVPYESSMELLETMEEQQFEGTRETDILNKNESANDSVDNSVAAGNLQHISCFQIKSEDSIEHIKVVETPKIENELKNSPFFTLETNWANEKSANHSDALEYNTDSQHSQMADSNETLIISEIKIEESQICDDIGNVNKETDGEWFRCHLCPRKYKARNNYVYHLKHKHGILKEKQRVKYTGNNERKDKSVKCRLCDFVAKNHCRLYYHTRTRHTTEEDKFKCQFCSYKHIMKRKLFNHTRRTHKDLIKTLRAEAKSKDELGTSNNEASTSTVGKLLPTANKFANSNSLDQKSKKSSLNSKTQADDQSSDEEFIKKILNIKKINYPKRYDPKSWARHCEECGKFCKDYDSFYAHKQIHRTEDEKIPCPHCDKKFNRKSELRGHIKRIHEKREKELVCPSCNFATALKRELNLHFREQHSGERPFKCDICSQSYRRKNALQEHIRRHNIEKQTCADCGKLVKHLKPHKRYCWARN